MAKITLKQIRKELDILIKEKKKGCTNNKERNLAINEARREINVKYGKYWRQRFQTNSKRKDYDFSKPAFAQDLGDEWDDYPWRADDF